jgi:RHS repeat-associated protein
VQEQTSTGTPTANLLTGGVDEIFTRTDTAGTLHPLGDAQGSTITTSDGSGAVGTTYTYGAFGQTTQSGAGGIRAQYTGRENDGTGLYYYRARYYAPALQRFISEDRAIPSIAALVA